MCAVDGIDLEFLDPLLIGELLAIGLVAGFLAGLLGIGGGMMMVPFLTMILTHRGVASGLAVKMAIASGMATILFTSLSSLRAHWRRGAVRWEIVRAMAPGILFGGLVAGAGAFTVLKGAALALFFAIFIGFSATQMLRDRRPKPSRQMPGAIGTAATGAGIGFVSGLLGAGGAFMAVPFMTWCNVPIHHATGTASAIGFPIALASTAGFVLAGRGVESGVPGAVGYLVLPAIAVIALASVFAAPQGARVAHSLDMHRLKRVFAVLLYALAAYMAWQAFN